MIEEEKGLHYGEDAVFAERAKDFVDAEDGKLSKASDAAEFLSVGRYAHDTFYLENDNQGARLRICRVLNEASSKALVHTTFSSFVEALVCAVRVGSHRGRAGTGRNTEGRQRAGTKISIGIGKASVNL